MSHFLTLKKEQFKMGNISSPLDCYWNDEIPPKPQSDGHNTAWTERGTQILAAEGWVTLTECFCQHSLRTGLFFLCTTTSCMSSRDGCWPISSSKGSMYSSTGPAEGTPVKPSLCRGGGEDCSVGNGGQNQKPAWFGLDLQPVQCHPCHSWDTSHCPRALPVLSQASPPLARPGCPSRPLLTVGGRAARGELPEHQSHGVHVYPQERVPLEVDGTFQHLWGHVPAGAHLQGHQDTHICVQNQSQHGPAAKQHPCFVPA